MDPMITLLLDYLYNKFAITFVFSLAGISIKEIANNVGKNNHIKIRILVSSSIFSTVVMCAVKDYINMSFSIYVLVCVISGMWSAKLIKIANNSKFMSKFIVNLFKKITNPITDAISDTIEDTNKNTKNKSNPKDKE